MAICVVSADAAPIQTASGRRKRADSTIVASIVLSGSSATNTVANAVTTAAGSTTSQSNVSMASLAPKTPLARLGRARPAWALVHAAARTLGDPA